MTTITVRFDTAVAPLQNEGFRMCSHRMCPPARWRHFVLPSLGIAAILGLGRGASAQQVSFRPTASVYAAYDSNVFSAVEDPTADWYGAVSLNFPLAWRIGPRSSLSLGYSASGEWYQDLKQLDQFPSRQSASLGYSYGEGGRWRFGLHGGYSESQRSEDVFPGSGVDLGRAKAQSIGGGVSLGRSLGQHGSLDLGYSYGRALYLDDQETGNHNASATLGRRLGPRTSGDIRYTYETYGFSDEFAERNQTVTAGISRQLSRQLTVSLRGGVRFVRDEVHPDGDVSISFSSRNPSLTIFYGHSRQFVPVGVSEGALSDTDRAGVSLGFEGRRYRISLGPSYYRNSSETFRSETWRGSLDVVYRLMRWLGAGGGYVYTIQRDLSSSRGDTKRYVTYVGFVFTPRNLWGDSVGLR